MIQLLEELLRETRQLDFIQQAVTHLQKNTSVQLVSTAGSLKSIVIGHLFETLQRPLVWIFDEQDAAQQAKVDLEHLLPVKASTLFPVPRKSKWGHDDVVVVAQQAEAIDALLGGQPHILLIAAPALATRVKSPKEYAGSVVKVSAGSEYAYESFVRQLHDMGFIREPVVEKPGDIAVRGGIVDVFPFTASNPYRIEFWGNQIASIREFDAGTQRSTVQTSNLRLFPKPEATNSSGAGVVDYLPKTAIVAFDDTPKVQRQTIGVHKDSNGLLPQDDDGQAGWEEFLRHFAGHAKLYFSPIDGRFAEATLRVSSRQPQAFNGNVKLFASTLRANGQAHASNFFLCESRGHAERIRELFADYALTEETIKITGLNLNRGFELPEDGIYVYTDHEFYGRVRRQVRRKRFKDGLTLRQLKALSAGDFVVHADHGIGRFLGLEKISVHGHERECLLLGYRDGDKLYVPLDKMDRVQKYTGKDGTVPTVHKLGAQDWDRLKKKAKAKARDIARDLIQLYSMRKAQQGFAFGADTTWQRELEASFPYEDTPDQHRAALEVKRDMEKDAVMDRLICGDVGYGKTEVAIRAAFKAVQDGRQVAVLVPTTILAEQHFQTFRSRMQRFPVRVEALSRFRSTAEQKRIIADVKAGKADIVIGTHRLLSKDVEFKSLGLLVIDEEHRFGVRHKERLKQLRINVDVIALTATPIPRTLNMSLLGIRDMSQINTPPHDRLPVHTETMEYDPKTVREAILYEMQRGGQVFFVHNRVQSIEQMAYKLKELVPEADIVIGHGQMREAELEKVIMEFINKKHDILVSTMIIESGLDMPNVNTIFINRADKFGLAQLYQLRGRVGRSFHKGYCYLIVPPLRSLTPDAVRRLETIEEFTDLGSGIQIALRDLEIRGAGNLLGAEQSGLMEALGFETYMKILEEAIQEMRSSKLDEAGEDKLLAAACRVDADFDAYLPQMYVEVAAERVDIYRRLAHAVSDAEVAALEDEVRDRFGRLPAEAAHLFLLARAKLLGKLAGFSKLVVRPRMVRGTFSAHLSQGDRGQFQRWLSRLVAASSRTVEFVHEGGFEARLRIKEDEHALQVTVEFLLSIVQGEVAVAAAEA